MQAVHVTNQSVMYRIMPDARNRLTAGYMTSYFIGGALGSLLSASAYQHAGWYGVAAAGGVLCLLNLLTRGSASTTIRRGRRQSDYRANSHLRNLLAVQGINITYSLVMF